MRALALALKPAVRLVLFLQNMRPIFNRFYNLKPLSSLVTVCYRCFKLHPRLKLTQWSGEFSL